MIMRILDIPIKILKIIIGLNMLGSLLLIFINVGLRTFGYGTLAWVEPLVIYLIMWTVFLGTGLVFADDEHLSMGVIYDFASARWKKILNVVNMLITVAVSVFLIYFGYMVTRNLYILGQTSMDGSIPLYLIMMSIPIGGITAIVCIIANAVKGKLSKVDERGNAA